VGSSSPAGGLSSVDIAVCTIEKANNLLNRLIQNDAVDQLGKICSLFHVLLVQPSVAEEDRLVC